MQAHPKDSGPPHILIVEDDANLSETLTSLLQAQGCVVVKTMRVQDAVLKLMNQRFDCVLLDLRLLGGDGEEVIAHIRNDRVNKDAHIFVMSGYLNKDIIERVRSRVNGILVKPFEPKVLIDKVQHAIRGNA